MDNTTYATIVLVLLWLYLCCQAVGSLVAPIHDHITNEVVYSTIIVSTVILGVCLWQCRLAGYLVSPMTWYHWVLLVLLVLLQGLAVILVVSEKLGWGIVEFLSYSSSYPIYSTAVALVVLLVLLGGTLFCGWKCNLFCRPCCKSQYICYGSAVVVVLVILTALAMTVSMARFLDSHRRPDAFNGNNDIWATDYICKMVLPCTQCYSVVLLWNTIFRLPYTIPEVVPLVTSALAVASLIALAVAVLGGTPALGVKLGNRGYPFLAVHLISLGITLYFLECKASFCCPKQYLCFGILSIVLVVTLAAIVVAYSGGQKEKLEVLKYTLLGYPLLLMVPVFWYAYRCGLLSWCLPKKKGLKATDTAENTTAETDIATE